jgi:hypothetical protein
MKKSISTTEKPIEILSSLTSVPDVNGVNAEEEKEPLDAFHSLSEENSPWAQEIDLDEIEERLKNSEEILNAALQSLEKSKIIDGNILGLKILL